ncbi:MAG TPA: choice-of-anchor Q domain-containing protein, partial [Anaerolineae bacterium]|nr:choice-of-anchor Q domain-containing protein [Anaerolineae bacterium]
LLNNDGSFTYTPHPDALGSDTFTYQVNSGNLQATATATIDILPAKCWATNDNGTTLFATHDASAITHIIDQSPPHTTIKVAGHCQGVRYHANQYHTLYLDKSLTIQGGYTTTNWLNPNPNIHNTVIDAGQQGRVIHIEAGNVYLDGLTISGGHNPADTYGGGIWNQGHLTVTNSLITNNHSINHYSEHNSTYNGGAIHNLGYLNLNHSQITANQPHGVWGQGYELIRHSLINNNTTTGLVNVELLEYSEVSYNQGNGLSSYNITIAYSYIHHNDGTGAIFFGSLSNLIKNSVLAYNLNGGVSSSSSNTTIINSTIHHNEASQHGGGVTQCAIVPYDLINNSLRAEMHIINSTISHNSAAGSGGGVYNCDGSRLDNITYIDHSTIAYNSSPDTGGLYDEQFMEVQNSIIAHNSNGNCGGSYIHSTGYALVSDNSCAFTHDTDLNNTDPRLAPLAANGGAGPLQADLLTHALHLDSPAINRVPFATNSCNTTILTDQRGISRATGGACDLGAYEVATHETTAQSVSYGESGHAYFPIHIQGSHSEEITLHYVTLPGTATPGRDYTPTNGTITIPANNNYAYIAIPLLTDNDAEPAETFYLRITGAPQANLTVDTVTATILDTSAATHHIYLPFINLP